MRCHPLLPMFSNKGQPKTPSLPHRSDAAVASDVCAADVARTIRAKRHESRQSCHHTQIVLVEISLRKLSRNYLIMDGAKDDETLGYDDRDLSQWILRRVRYCQD